MAESPFGTSEFSRLRGRIEGEALTRGDADFESARGIYNAMHDRRPALIVRPAGPRDVAAAVDFARSVDIPVAVRGGGHSVVGFSTCDDGLVIDLRSLSEIEVDADRRVAKVGGGATWAQFNDAAYPYGLATPGGVVSTTGVGGLTLGGGIGHLTRQYGLACDNVSAAEVVTADGSLVRCDGEHDSDLHWAIRGGGGNFGVVTSFEFQMHPVGDIIGGPIFFALEPGVLEGYWKLMREAPRQLGTLLGLLPAPPLPFIEEEWHGKPVVSMVVCWTGAPEELEEILEPTRRWGRVVGRYVETMPYPTVNTLFDELLPAGLRHYWKSLIARSDVPSALPDLMEWGASVPNVESGIFFHPIHGACHDIPAAGTAFPHRDARYLVGIYGIWHHAEDDAAFKTWVRNCYEALRPHYFASEYVNFACDQTPGSLRSIYGANFDRLVEIKRRYDPENLFRLNQNIEPAVV